MQDFLNNATNPDGGLGGRTQVTIVCECIEDGESVEVVIRGNSAGEKSLLQATPFGYKGAIVGLFRLAGKTGQIPEFYQGSDNKGTCFSNRTVYCVSAELQFQGDYINGASLYTWSRIKCTVVRVQEIDVDTLIFEIK